jgi:hypothetical protein
MTTFIFSSKKAQALTEFGLLLPLFLVLIFAIIESSLLMNAQGTLDNAIREGARVGALCGSATGTWIAPDGTQYSSGPEGSPCPEAIAHTINKNLGIIPTAGNYPTISIIAPVSNIGSSCTGTGSTYYAPTGCPIQIQVSYPYRFYFNLLVGASGPSLTLKSSAVVVSQ